MRMMFAAAAFSLLAIGAAEARVVRIYEPVFPVSTAPSVATAREYDREHTFARVHGYWRVGGQHAGWSRGDRIGAGAQAIDWRTNDLYPPRSGYYWTRIGDDFLLVSRTGNMIREIVLAPPRAEGVIATPAKAAKRTYVTTFKRPVVQRPASYYEK